VARQTPQQIVDQVLSCPRAPVPGARPGRAGPQGRVRALLDELAKQGFARARVDGEVIELADRADARPGPLRAAHHRGGGRPPRGRRDDIRQRLTESVETALKLTEGWPRSFLFDADGTTHRRR
jgi:excinuclease ABC subunit A